MISNTLNAEAEMRIQLSPVKSGTKEIFKKNASLFTYFFSVLENIVIFHRKSYTCNVFTIILKYINKYF